MVWRTPLWEILDPPLHTSINSFDWCPSQHCSYTIFVDSLFFAFSNIPSDPSIASVLLYPLSFSWKFNFGNFSQLWIFSIYLTMNTLLQYNVTLQGSFLCNKSGAFAHSSVKAEKLGWYHERDYCLLSNQSSSSCHIQNSTILIDSYKIFEIIQMFV